MASAPDLDDTGSGSSLLSRFLESEVDLEEALDRALHQQDRHSADESGPLRALVPGEVFAADGLDLGELLGSVLTEYDEIEGVLEALDEMPEAREVRSHEAVAFVSERELADPEALDRAVEPLRSESSKFHFLFVQAQHALERLSAYELSRLPAEDLIEELRRKDDLRSVQYLVEFLRALHLAADTFEALEIPHTHIREYLRHLYLMRDWREMSRLVQHLEGTVGKVLKSDAG